MALLLIIPVILVILTIFYSIQIPLFAALIALVKDVEPVITVVAGWVLVWFLAMTIAMTSTLFFRVFLWLLHLINKPQAGTVGTVGLILALTSYMLSHLI